MAEPRLIEAQDSSRVFAFTLFMYAGQPWSETKTAVGALLTDGIDVIVLLKKEIADRGLVNHFATCSECAAKDRIALVKGDPIKVLEETVSQAIDKGTSLSFGQVKQIAAVSVEEAVACIRDCFLAGGEAERFEAPVIQEADA